MNIETKRHFFQSFVPTNKLFSFANLGTIPQPQYYAATAPIITQQLPNYGTTTATHTVIIPQPEIIIVGACPACRIGVLEDDYTCLGLLCAILFFPLGILCCLALKNRRCSNCGAYFG